MNRIIKFRAWEFATKEFMYLNPSKEKIDSDWLKNDEQSVCQQYTGLKDYSNHEIYEGDIVKFTRTDDIPSAFDSVEVIENMHEIYNHCWEKGIDYSDIQVIGNIYQNKELLK